MTTSLPSLRATGPRDPVDVLRIAHRGDNGAAEYAAASQRRIAAAGAHLVEFDVRVTGDDKLVVSHDPVVVAGSRAWPIADHSAADLYAAASSRVPSLRSVAGAARDAGLGLYVDLKSLSQRAATRLAATLRAEGMADRTVLASQDPEVVRMCARAAPDLPRAALVRSIAADPVHVATDAGAEFVHPCWEDHPRPDRILAGAWLDAVRGAGLGVICWHEERPEVLAALYALGVDGICSDRPELLVLASRATDR